MKNALVERMLYILLLLTFIGGGIMAYVAVSATDQLNKQQARLDEQQQVLVQQAEDIHALLDGQAKVVGSISNSLLCVITFFGLPDRNELVITSLDPCTVVDVEAGQSRQLELPQALPQQEPAGNNQQQSNGNTPPAANNPPANQPPPSNGGSTPPPAEEHQPVEVFGIPVCIPLTTVCITR